MLWKVATDCLSHWINGKSTGKTIGWAESEHRWGPKGRIGILEDLKSSWVAFGKMGNIHI